MHEFSHHTCKKRTRISISKVRQRTTALGKIVPGYHAERITELWSKMLDIGKRMKILSNFQISVLKGGNVFAQVIVYAKKGGINTIKETYPGNFLQYKNISISLYKFDTDELDDSCSTWILDTLNFGSIGASIVETRFHHL